MEQIRAQIHVEAAVRNADPVMTPHEVRAARSDILSFGSHALTHPSLPALESEEARREIMESIHRCQAVTGQAPSAFAYPFGDYDNNTEEMVRTSGFACACTVERRRVLTQDRSTALPRVAVGNWPAQRFARVLSEL
jgi:peptidoglycan/xylan/chitin deacetylase (PgdA/CDA1 family)